MSKQHPRGFVLPFALILAAMLSLSANALLRKLQASANVSADIVGRKRAFYAADGVGRAIVRRAANYTSSTGSPDVTGLRAAVSTTFIDSILPSGFIRDGAFVLNYGGASSVAPLPSGPFQGMQAKQQFVDFELKLRDQTTKAAGFTKQTVALAQVSMFQFFYFVDLPYMDIRAVPGTWTGRLHSNGRLCIGGNLELDKVTSAGEIYQGSNVGTADSSVIQNTKCMTNNNLTNNGMTSSIKDSGGSYVALQQNNDHGCTSCTEGGATGWKEYALARWDGNVQDKAHDVPLLKVPVQGRPRQQSGKDMENNARTNNNTSRFLVDPPLASDGVDILDQKFACKADIRIINGIWFMKNSTTTCDWPGTPIWSDHPGTYTTGANTTVTGNSNFKDGNAEGTAVAVGQGDLFTSSARPRRYSYYWTDTGHSLGFTAGGTPAVVSYGSLIRTGTSAYQPGSWVRLQNSADEMCRTCTAGTCPGGTATLYNATTTPPFTCKEGVSGSANTITQGDLLLNGARSGFADTRVAENGSDWGQGQVVPMNFDVSALAGALGDTATNELGARFNTRGRPFNGIVYITSSWPNSGNGYGESSSSSPAEALASLWADQGTIGNGTASLKPVNAPTVTQRGVPYPLCTSSSTLNLGAAFRSQPCSGTNDLGTVNAVRIIGGNDLSSFSSGLTIATNLPVYLVGNYNNASTWRPALVAGDAITLVSGDWVDNVAESRFGQNSIGSGANGRDVMQAYTYKLALLAGNVAADNNTWGGGLNNFTRFMENWQSPSRQNIITGSLVMGFLSVFQRQPFIAGSNTYTAPERIWGFDSRFDDITKQPPGAPIFTVSATRRWARQ